MSNLSLIAFCFIAGLIFENPPPPTWIAVIGAMALSTSWVLFLSGVYPDQRVGTSDEEVGQWLVMCARKTK